MNTKKGLFDQLIDVSYKFIFNICKVFLLLQTLLTTYVVFGRFVLNSTPSWGEELALLCMVWFSLLSASLAIKTNSHIRLTLVEMIFPKKVVKYANYFTDLLILNFSVCLVIGGLQLTIQTVNTIMPGSNISTMWLNLSVPVAGLCIIIMLFGKERGNS